MALDSSPLCHRLTQHLQHLAIPRDPDWSPQGHQAVQAYIAEHLGQWGSVQALPFWREQQTHHNWRLRIPGRQPDRWPILVGAHFDAVPGSPGADDNASGVAVLLELARFWAEDPPLSPVDLVAFDLEERGLLGSTAYVQHHLQPQDPLRLMISLEMLGYQDLAPHSQHYPHPLLKSIYPSQGHFIALVGNPALWRPMSQLCGHFHRQGIRSRWLAAPNRGLSLPDIRRSDHAPFWDRGHNALLITDTANLRNPHYHRLTDTPDTLDLSFLTGICLGLAYGIRSL
jgi:Zn-dependent M28 family amino/carboxypeptidase